MNRRQVRDLSFALTATALVLAVGFAIGAGGWPGERSGCIANQDCYCEAFTGGIVEQPVNTLSNLAFVGVGLWVLWSASRPAGRANPMTEQPLYARTYGGVTIFLGVGSMFFHGSMTEWGGWVDLVSMHLFITFFLLYDLARRRDRSPKWFLARFVAANVALGGVLWVMDNGFGKFVFGALVVAALVVDLRLTSPELGPGIHRDRRWFWAGLATYLAGQAVWLLSRDGAPLCAPDSLLQGHALWHITSALAVAWFYLYFRSERIRADRRLPELV